MSGKTILKQMFRTVKLIMGRILSDRG